MTETCPTCGGDPKRPTIYCGSGGCYAEYRVCPFCGGLGEVARTRNAWTAIGQRLKAARIAHMVRIGDDHGRWVYTLDKDVPEQSMPLYAQAHRWHIPERAVEQIEAGKMDPWSIAHRVSSWSWPLEAGEPHCPSCRCRAPYLV